MTEQSVRQCAIDDPICPVCLRSTLGQAGVTGKSGSSYIDQDTGEEFPNPTEWWKSTCSNCRSIVERHLIAYGLWDDGSLLSTITEEVSPSDYGLVLRENRELKA